MRSRHPSACGLFTAHADSGRCVTAYLCIELHVTHVGEDRRIHLVILIPGALNADSGRWPTVLSQGNPSSQILQLWVTCSAVSRHLRAIAESDLVSPSCRELLSRPVDQLFLGSCGDLNVGSYSCLIVRFGSLDQLAVPELRARTDERDEVRRVDLPPAALRRLDELERHRDPRGP